MQESDSSNLLKTFQSISPNVDYWSLRHVNTQRESLCIRQDHLQPPAISISNGVYISVIKGNGCGYAATSDTSLQGLKLACEKAVSWADMTRSINLVKGAQIPVIENKGSYQTPVKIPWDSTRTSEKIDYLKQACSSLKISDKIVDWSAWLGRKTTHVTLVTSAGGHIEQEFHYLSPGLVAVANSKSETQKRTGGGYGDSAQGGLELFEHFSFPDSGHQIAEEALQLLDAPQCPSGNMDLLILPSQMVLQIHESIGHPLELDRILGDERNYAGTSFVTLDMFGKFRYGSELLNVTFDPEHSIQLASYGYDDDGTRASRTYIIKNGILERPLGGACSQSRTDMPGVANSRSCDWNRPPIDRMANLNLEPGNSSLNEMISSIENGILLDTNKSWSIDDSRNKFQFGCEIGKIIKDGQITETVKNPNYRGISRNFWKNLSAVGNKDTFRISGTPNCGKGEPNQVIHVGHASPACVFTNIDVFGGI